MRDPFFTADNGFPTIRLALEDILPEEMTRAFRDKALMGHLTPPDFAHLHTLLTAMKSQAQYTVTRRPRHHTLAAYVHLNSFAMLLAQILFVDNSLKEGLPGRIEDAARDRVLDGLSAWIRARSATNGAALAPEDVRFHATLFLLQTAFDTLFVADEDIVTYDTISGAYHVTDRYDHCIRYLALSGRKITTASRAERNLCDDITTGSGDHIDRGSQHFWGRLPPASPAISWPWLAAVRAFSAMLEATSWAALVTVATSPAVLSPYSCKRWSTSCWARSRG
jgi:hypothetical protein